MDARRREVSPDTAIDDGRSQPTTGGRHPHRDYAAEARAHCDALRRLMVIAPENELEIIAALIAGLTQREAFDSLSSRVLAEMREGQL